MLSRVPLFLFVAATATAALADATDDIVNAALREQHVPGAWVAVLKDGKVVKKSGYGLANIELGVKVTPETMMQTGSIGKMFTSEGILLLAKDGKLCLEDSLAKFFPGAPDWWKPITIRRMLSHTAGIPEYEGDKYSIDVKKEYTEDQMVDFVEKMTPDYSPGRKVGLQQYRLHAVWRYHPQAHRPVLRRLSSRPSLESRRHENDPHQ